MPRYIVERNFPDGFSLPVNQEGAAGAMQVVGKNADEQVTWIVSYFNQDKTRSYCVYDGPSPEAVRSVARRNSLPADRVTQVQELSPYFFH